MSNEVSYTDAQRLTIALGPDWRVVDRMTAHVREGRRAVFVQPEPDPIGTAEGDMALLKHVIQQHDWLPEVYAAFNRTLERLRAQAPVAVTRADLAQRIARLEAVVNNSKLIARIEALEDVAPTAVPEAITRRLDAVDRFIDELAARAAPTGDDLAVVKFCGPLK